jgi:hypothetical protein
VTKVRPDSSFVDEQAKRMTELIRQRSALSREDLEYLVLQTEKLKDNRMKQCIAELVGWGDEERAELETFVAVALEVMRKTSVSRLREAARIVELRYYTKETT